MNDNNELDNNELNKSKMTPYEFYNSIGSPKYIVAPMVDHSDLPYRLLTRRYKADLVYTQMFNANMFIQSNDFRNEIFQTNSNDRPLIVQLAGHDPMVLLKAAKFVEDRCDAIDINLGCPQGIAKRGRYGAFLMEELDLLHDIVSTLVKGLKIPVTCKTRIYKDFNQSIRLCETLVNAGASMLVIHGRTREEKGTRVNKADWDMIKRIKSHFKDRVPIISNGGISSFEDIQYCIDYTGVDGVMTSEAILENPALFVNNICPYTGQYKSILSLAEEYLQLCLEYPVPHIRIIRSHLMKSLNRYIMHHHDIRDQIVVAQTIEEFIDLFKQLKNIIGEREKDYKDSWYFRHMIESSAIDNSNGNNNCDSDVLHTKNEKVIEINDDIFESFHMFNEY